ncbi:MAG: NAD(P)/FAD-dependent oxidoreductase [Anaerolinea sp.]|nr:NAD(P)/FAD-dependent oxidoreductase [Anaerolinea sp.]
MTITSNNNYDVAIVGAGPAGLQAALVLSRTRKHIIVFDSPEPPRNHASHGVHNLLGLDGLLPDEIRERSWSQISVYESARRIREAVIAVQPADGGDFALTGSAGTAVRARHVVLAVGYRDVYPEVPGFRECWGSTIIPCPFCDGYENRDRVWGLVANSELALEHMPLIVKHWTTAAKLFLPAHVTLTAARREVLEQQGIGVYKGEIVAVHHTHGMVEGVTLTSGEQVDVQTLWWRPPEAPLPLTRQVIDTFHLELDSSGFIKTDAFYQTGTPRLWAVGDIKGWAGALGAAQAAGLAATAIVRDWYA